MQTHVHLPRRFLFQHWMNTKVYWKYSHCNLIIRILQGKTLTLYNVLNLDALIGARKNVRVEVDKPLVVDLSAGFSWLWSLSNVMATAVTATWEAVKNRAVNLPVSSGLWAISQVSETFHLYEFFFWHCYSEFEMTETAGDHRAQLEVKTLKQIWQMCNSSFKPQAL